MSQKELSPKSLDILGKLTDLSDRVFDVQARIMAPILRHHGHEIVRTETGKERVNLFAEQLAIASIEGGGIKEILASLGGEDGDLDELARALQKSELVRNAQPYKIRIKKVPEGAAPEGFRKCWQWISPMRAIKANNSEGDFDLLTHQAIPDRGEVYIVSTRQAIDRLGEVSSGAANWFRKNTHIPFLTFKADEVEVIPVEKKEGEVL